MISLLLDWIYPPYCILCENRLEFSRPARFCRNCYRNLPWIKAGACRICGRFLNNRKKHDACCNTCSQQKPYFTKGLSLFNFKPPLSKEMGKIKYNGNFTHIHTFSLFLSKKLSELKFCGETCITYVPLHPVREKERGFNQSRLLAIRISKILRISVKPLLKRDEYKKPQATLKVKQRRQNVLGIFSINKKIKKPPESVIIIDDVMTTGSTLNECARILQKNGVKNITVATIFSVPDEVNF